MGFYQWKMSFNPDINKKAPEVYFSQRRKKSLPPPIIFNNNVMTSPCQNTWVLSWIANLVSMIMLIKK